MFLCPFVVGGPVNITDHATVPYESDKDEKAKGMVSLGFPGLSCFFIKIGNKFDFSVEIVMIL